VAIAMGSTVGGVLFDSQGFRSTFVLSATVLLLAAFLSFVASRAHIRERYGRSRLQWAQT
jgi:predicted MFS family arabinose efflux permease